MLTPRDYQLADVQKLRLVLRRVRAVIYQLPTGAGKTIVAGYIASLLADRGKRALVLVHRRELVRQFSKTLTQAGLGDQYGIIAAGRAETRWARFQIASVQSINRRETGWLKPDLVIVDEAHHVKAKTWENVLGRFPDTKVLGLTATPGRLDGKPLGDHFDTLVQGPSIGELVEQGDLAPMRVLRPEQGLSTAGVSTMAGDWNKKDLDERLTDQVIAAGAAAYRRYGAGKRAIFFAVNRRHSKAIVESLSKEGFRAEHIDAETDVRRRDLVLKEFGEGLIQVVSNVDLISEGTDVPECEVIMMGRPTKSVTMYLQQAGRAMRPGEGKTALLLDLAGNSWDLGLPDEERSWDLEGTRQGAAVDKRPVGMRQRCCSACAEVYSSRLLACPSCGTEHVLPKPLEVETELSEAAPSERTPKMISRRQMKSRLAAVMRRREGYEGLVRIGKDFGYKPGLSRKEALREVKGEMHSTQPKPRKKESRPSRPYWISGLPENAITRHRYLLGDGSLAFVVCRFPKGAQAKCKPYTPAKRGGSDGWTMNLAIREGRPLYRLREMNKASSGKQVMVVEGEKCADAVASAFPKAVVTTWHGGAKAWKYTDWSPLEGRRVLLVSDADSEGRKCMFDLARHLKGLECTDIRIALPEGEDHRDIADEIAEGGGQAAGEWLKRLAVPWKPPEPEKTASKQPKKKKDPPPPANAADNDYFRILGNVGDSIPVRLATHQIMLYSRSALTQPSTLISLAAYNWWLDLLTQESLTPSSCHSVGSALIRAADRQGQIDLSRVAGRGFFRNDNNSYVWNLGDRLLVDGREGELDSLQDGWHYVNGPRIEVAEKRAGHGERKRVAEAVERYRWQHPLDGRRFLGWLVSSIVGGALEWRPHIWLAAAAETGKSWLLKRVAARLLGPMVVRVADATPAAMARRMRSDSLPLILDEAEPDRQWIEGLMDLIRVAAGGDGERIRTDVGGNVQRLHPRFSVCMSSTKIANLRAADASRFQMLNLSLKGVENWPEVERAIGDSLANGACERIRAALIHEGHEVVEEAASVSRELMRGGHGDACRAIAR